MRAELATRNAAGIFSGNCPHCGEYIRADVCCGDEFACPHCVEGIQVQNYGETLLFTRAKVTILPRGPRRARTIDPETYMDY